ncbi:hypothetical protein H0A65_00300 [Alcaligenaceae bacterium]|nr:hypothetical protein [Alcaligenaceae bacterium]
MNSTNNETWGFLHPECHGQQALMFFSWDLAKTIEQQFQLHTNSSLDVQVYEAQKAVDRLIKQYVQIQANPAAFEGQSIKLTLEEDEADPQASVLALQTSPHLEALILQAQEQHQGSGSIN